MKVDFRTNGQLEFTGPILVKDELMRYVDPPCRLVELSKPTRRAP